MPHDAYSVNRHVTHQCSYFPYSLFSLITQIRFAQDDDRTRTTPPGEGQVPFDTSWVEVFIERRDKENSIDVGPTICGSVRTPAILRVNLLFRGKTAWIVTLPLSGDGRITTQSPTAGRSPRSKASCRSLPAVSPSTFPIHCRHNRSVCIRSRRDRKRSRLPRTVENAFQRICPSPGFLGH